MITWEIWLTQSQKKHKDDSQKEFEKLQQEVKKEIDTGTQHIRELTPLFSITELKKVQEGTQGYARAWL
jgi:hypothetical protein